MRAIDPEENYRLLTYHITTLELGGSRPGHAFIGVVPAAGQAVLLGRPVTPRQPTKWGKVYFGLTWNVFRNLNF